MGTHVEIVPTRVPDRLLLLVVGCPSIERLRPEPAFGAPYFAQSLFPMESYVLFEGVKQLGNRSRFIFSARVRIDDHVQVLGHDDVSDQADAESSLDNAKALSDNSLHPVVLKKGQAPSAGDRPEVSVARLVVPAKVRGHDRECRSSTPPGPKDLGHPSLLKSSGTRASRAPLAAFDSARGHVQPTPPGVELHDGHCKEENGLRFGRRLFESGPDQVAANAEGAMSDLGLHPALRVILGVLTNKQRGPYPNFFLRPEGEPPVRDVVHVDSPRRGGPLRVQRDFERHAFGKAYRVPFPRVRVGIPLLTG